MTLPRTEKSEQKSITSAYFLLHIDRLHAGPQLHHFLFTATLSLLPSTKSPPLNSNGAELSIASLLSVFLLFCFFF